MQNTKLSSRSQQQRFFTVTSKSDIQEYQYFLKHNQWKTPCNYVLEWPHITIPDMIKDKLIMQYIELMAKNAT